MSSCKIFGKLILLNLSFLICKTDIIMSVWPGVSENKLKNCMEEACLIPRWVLNELQLPSLRIYNQSANDKGICHSAESNTFFHLRVIIAGVGLPQWLCGKESICNVGNAGDLGSFSGSGNSPEGGSRNLLQYSCLRNPMDRGAWPGTVHRAAKSQIRQSDGTHTRSHHRGGFWNPLDTIEIRLDFPAAL